MENDGSVYLAQEFKYAIGRDSLEVFSGGFEDNESPLDAARRELEEELGMLADEWTDLGVVDPFTTVINSPNFMFLARGLRQGTARPDEGEVVRVVRLPFKDVLERVLSGQITHSASVVVILKAARIIGA